MSRSLFIMSHSDTKPPENTGSFQTIQQRGGESYSTAAPIRRKSQCTIFYKRSFVVNPFRYDLYDRGPWDSNVYFENRIKRVYNLM